MQFREEELENKLVFAILVEKQPAVSGIFRQGNFLGKL